MNEFTPQQILEVITRNTEDLVMLGNEITVARTNLMQKEAALFDAEYEARSDIFLKKEEVQASKIRDYIKWRAAKEQKEYSEANNILRSLMEKKSIKTELINTAKCRLRVLEMEIKGLNYYPDEQHKGVAQKSV
jgi:hypothetical protein